jgi:DNA-binding Lrp family transcriptional regulator
MSTALGLALQISANTAQLATAVQDVNKRLDEMGGAGKKAANDLSVLKNIEIARVFIDGIKLVADGLVTAARSAKRLFDDSRQAIDALGKLSKQTQISVEALQTYGAIAEEAGVGSEEFARSLRRLTVELGKADVDKDNAFKKIGLDVKALKELKPEDIFLEVADALANISNDAERAAAANEVFGKGGITLLPLINGGADALKRAADEAGRIGGVLTQDQVSQVEALNDRFTQVGRAIQGIINQVTAALAPALEGIAQQLLDVFNRFGGANIGKFIADSILRFADGFISAIQSLVELVQRIGKGITEILTKLGLDIRSDDEKRLAELERRARLAATLEQGGGTARSRIGSRQQLAAAGGALSAEEAAELDRLQQKFANTGNAIQDSLEGVRDSIARGRSLIEQSFEQQRVDAARPEVQVRADLPEVGVEGVTEAIEDLQESTDEQTATLEELRRDLLGVSARPAEILGGA